MRTPAALLALPLLAGVPLGLAAFDVEHLARCAAGGAFLALVAGIAAHLDRLHAECVAAVVIGSLLSGLSLGASEGRRVYAPSLLDWFALRTDTSPVPLDGILREDASAGPFGVTLLLDVRSIGPSSGDSGTATDVEGGIRLIVAGAQAWSQAGEWCAGRRLSVWTSVREPAVYLNPGAGDTRAALARRGVTLVGSIKSASLVTVTALGTTLDESGAATRAWARRRLADLVGRWGQRSAAIAIAILIGDRTGLPDEDERRLQEAGTYHVIAISGGNVAILTVFLLALARVAGIDQRSAAVAVILVLLFYGHLAGLTASVQRAVMAAVAYLLGRLIDQKGSTLNILASVAVLGIAHTPIAVVDPGFLLSFGATLGILLVVPVLQSVSGTLRGAAQAAAAVLFATIAAEIALAPIAALLFSRVTFAGLVLNFAAIPLMTIVQIGSMFVLAVSSLHEPTAAAAGYVVHVAADLLVESARLKDVAPWLAVAVLPPSPWLVLAYYASAAIAIASARLRRYGVAGVAFSLIALLAGIGAPRALEEPAPGTLRLVFVDVGQGDATLIRFPDGRAYLVDAGGLPAPIPMEATETGTSGFDVGDRVVTPTLRALRINRLDTFVLTHADPDHVGGAPAVIRSFQPRAIWEGVPVPPHAARKQIVDAAEAAAVEWRPVQTGEQVRVAQVDIRVLHPPRPDWERQRVRNDDSVVLELRYGDVSIILPGDIGKEGEAAVLDRLQRATITILKAAHHGSATSSSQPLLTALAPSLAIFSAGRANRFGHPAPAVVARYQAMGTTLFSTATDGAVIVDTDGKTVRVRGWTGREVTLGQRSE
jgi:competence protein ComEC